MTDIWLFDHLTLDEKAHLQGITRKRTYSPGEMLFLEDDPATSVFLLVEGRVKLFRTSEDGKEIIFTFLSPHDLFGEDALFSDAQRPMSAIAMEPTRTCACETSDFQLLVRSSPDLAVKTIQALGLKLHRVTDQLIDFVGHDVRDRVCSVLARLAREYGEASKEGLRLDFRLTHDDIAAIVGASRVMVTNVLGELRKRGLVVADGRSRITVSRTLLRETQTGTRAEETIAPPSCPCFQLRDC